MSFSAQLQPILTRLIGFQSPVAKTSTLTDPNGVTMDIDFLQVDALSCSVEEIRLEVPSLNNADMQTLEDWANALCGRITYLLENIGPLERDDQSGEVLIRSTPPSKQSTGTKYYEIMLKSRGGGRFTLKRYEFIAGTHGRSPIPMQMT
ncbi:MAG: hypothetical protein JJ992_13320, partial [Planctomycetes bacterium]|nr:hypothetical protein [Planctomycetota bacterium]